MDQNAGFERLSRICSKDDARAERHCIGWNVRRRVYERAIEFVREESLGRVLDGPALRLEQ
jgi:hypothetical protein